MEEKVTFKELSNEVSKKTSGALLYFFALAYGILFSELIFRGGFGIGVPITTALFYLFFVPFIVRKGKKFSLSGYLAFIPIVILSVCCGVMTSGPWKAFAVLTILVLQMLQLVKLSGISTSPFYSFSNGFKAIGAAVGTPFGVMGPAYKSIGGKSEKKSVSVIGKMVLGIAIAIPAVAILILMFSSADEMFEYYTDKTIDLFNIDWGGMLFDVIMGVLISLFLFPLIFGYRVGYNNEKESTSSGKGIDAIVLSAFIFMCDIVYVAFVVIQFTYLFSPGKELPVDMTYAEYGKSGFFQLVAIIIVTFAFIAVVINTVRKNKKGGVPFGIKLSLSVMTISDIIIAASAVYRMGMYLEAYGLTRSRLIACWFIAVICFVLLGVLVKIWASKVKICSYVGIVITVMVIALNVMNVDALIAKVNISRYLDEGKPLDFYYLSAEKLSPAVVPEVERLLDEGNKEDVRKAKYILATYYSELDDFGGEINYQNIKAKKILKDRKIVEYKREASLNYIERYLTNGRLCPNEYCYAGKCTAGGDNVWCSIFGKTYCAECGEPMCGYCYEHKTVCSKEVITNNFLDEYCSDCDIYSYSGDSAHCYCTECGKQLA